MYRFFKELKVNYILSAVFCILFGATLVVWPDVSSKIALSPNWCKTLPHYGFRLPFADKKSYIFPSIALKRNPAIWEKADSWYFPPKRGYPLDGKLSLTAPPAHPHSGKFPYIDLGGDCCSLQEKRVVFVYGWGPVGICPCGFGQYAYLSGFGPFMRCVLYWWNEGRRFIRGGCRHHPPFFKRRFPVFY